MSLSDFFFLKKEDPCSFAYFGAERCSEDEAALFGPLLFGRIAVTITGFSRSISPLARRAIVRCVSEYSYKKQNRLGYSPKTNPDF